MTDTHTTPSLVRQWMDDPELYRRAREEARRQAPLRWPHLFDPGLIERLTPIVWLDTSEDELVQPVKPVEKPPRQRGVARPALPPTLAPRLIGRDAAAAYVGVSPNTFDKMIADGLMPSPRRLSERRLAWDMRELDTAIDRLPRNGIADDNTDADTDATDHSWDDIDAQAQAKPVAH
jgi:predicted DNA-binding transcriptional regulator AlpA